MTTWLSTSDVQGRLSKRLVVYLTGVNREHMKSREKLQAIPFTTKERRPMAPSVCVPSESIRSGPYSRYSYLDDL